MTRRVLLWAFDVMLAVILSLFAGSRLTGYVICHEQVEQAGYVAHYDLITGNCQESLW